MGYMCKKSNHECDGCMKCESESHYYCPVCGKEIFETVFIDKRHDVIGCENCAETKEPHEVLRGEE